MPKFTLSMIVKNEEKFLRDCLISVKGLVDEIVVVDTGSSDNTIKIAEEYGAKTYHFEWINDFAAARNFALEKSTGDWILYLDADERLDQNSIPELKKIINSNERLACYCTVKSYDSEGSRDNSLQYPRLFSNSTGIKFTGKVHEQIEPSLLQNKYRVADTNILIHHLGYDITKDEKNKKARRNLSILLEEYNRQKTSYGAFQIAQSYNVLDEKENASKYFKIAGDSPDLDKTLRAQCFASLAMIAHNHQNTGEAENYIQLSIKLDDRQPFPHLLSSKIALRRGDRQAAEIRCRAAYQMNKNILAGKEKSKLIIILDSEEVIYFGLTLSLQSDNAANAGFYHKELTAFYSRKECAEGTLRLMVINKLFNNTSLTQDEEKIFSKMANKHTINLLLNLISSNPDKQQIIRLAIDLQKKFPDDIEIKKTVAKLFSESGRVEEAIQLLELAVEKKQHDPAVLFYLISFYLKTGTHEKIKTLMGILETNFSHIPEVLEKVQILRSKLQMLGNVPL
ncbi:MAG: glycosyltransferase [Melioribacteraceae bacterium]